MNKHIKYIGSYVVLSMLFTSNILAQQSDNTDKEQKDLFGKTVYSDVIEKTSETNVANALFGQISGLMVMQGVPSGNVLDDEASFYMRGVATSGTTTPLVLVDGIERAMSNIAPSEIAKIEVLNNAVASAIYGVRGANGVILITTKHGSEGFRAKVSYAQTFDFAFRLPEFVDAATYATLTNEALAMDGLDSRYSDREILCYQNGTGGDVYSNVDWQDEAYADFGQSYLANIEIDGGNKDIKYYAALDYSNVVGILDNTDLTDLYNPQLNKVNLNVMSNIDVKLTNTTDLKIGVLGRVQEQKRPGVSMETIVDRLYDTPAGAFPVVTNSGEWGSTSSYGYNPIADIADVGTVEVIRRAFFANMELNQNLDVILDGLYANALVAYDNWINYNDQRTRTYQYEVLSPVWDGDDVVGADRVLYGTQSELGWSSSLNNQEMTTTVAGEIGYNKDINLHQIGTKVRYEYISQVRDGQNSSSANASLMAIANYSYDNRYMVDLVVNYSGSSILKEGEQYNLYPAVGLGWVASREDFLKGNSVIDYLKINTSFGYSGSDNLANDLFVQSFGVTGNSYYFGSSNTTYSGLKDDSLPMTVVLAERSRKFDIGADLTLFKSLNLSATYFNEYRTNIKVDSSGTVSSVLGDDIPNLCQGIIANQGVEFSANYTGNIGDFRYNVSGNFLYSKNEIIDKNEGYQPEDYLYTTGNSTSQYYGLQSDGFFSSEEEIENWDIEQRFGDVVPGDVKYVDQNGDNVIDEYDIVRLGYSAIPEIYYGFNLDLQYKNFSLFAQFQGVAHRTIYLNTTSVNWVLMDNTNISKWYVEDNIPWTAETADTATLPRLTTVSNENNYQKSDLWMASGDYFKLRNLELAYTFNKGLFENTNLRLFVRGSNLFSLDSLGYADPENFGSSYPTMTSYTIGANITF
ncbi:MAG: SusC/RagA family TonB-linked outer membrane protein [Rikenellaceae bacterium]